MGLPLLLIRSTSVNGSADEINRAQDALDRDKLGINATIPFTTVRLSGCAARPLEFPAPVLDRAINVSADIVDHTTGQIFHATSVLMRRPVHAKTCTNASSTNSIPASPKMQSQHRREIVNNTSKSRILPPIQSDDMPEKAYCVRRKICNSTYGSVRLCVVLRRISSNVLNYATSIIPEHGSVSTADATGRVVAVAVPEWETTDEMVAIKVTSWSQLQSLRGRHIEDPIKEIAALQLLGMRHPHVISILDALQNDTHLFAVFPYMPLNLYSCLIEEMTNSPTGRIDESKARVWFRQILCGISQLQKKGICHRDLCIDNMVMDENKKIHIIDLGLALRIPFADPNSRMQTSDVSANTCRRLMTTQGQRGAWRHAAPEVRSRSASIDGFAIDLWAAGVVLFELLVGKKPFSLPDPSDRNFKSISEDGNLVALLQSRSVELSDQATCLLQNMLWSDPAKRLTLSDIVSHPWLEGSGKMSVSSHEEVGEQSNWFIKTKSIDDLDDSKPDPRSATSQTMMTDDTDAATEECSYPPHESTQPHESTVHCCSLLSSLQPPPHSVDSKDDENTSNTHQSIDTEQKKRGKWGSCFASFRAVLLAMLPTKRRKRFTLHSNTCEFS